MKTLEGEHTVADCFLLSHSTKCNFTEILTAGPGGPEGPVSPSFPARPCSDGNA